MKKKRADIEREKGMMMTIECVARAFARLWNRDEDEMKKLINDLVVQQCTIDLKKHVESLVKP